MSKGPMIIRPGFRPKQLPSMEASMMPQIKQAFEKQSAELASTTSAFNTMRILAIMLVMKLSPDEPHTFTLSAKEINQLSDKFQKISLHVNNKAEEDDVVLTVVFNEEDQTMSSDLSLNETEVATEAEPPVSQDELLDLPVLCQCKHPQQATDEFKGHIGGIGGCKEADCDCTEFKAQVT